MGLFSKTEVIETAIPFKIQQIPIECDYDEKDEKGGLIDFEAYGRIGDEIENRYYYALVGCNNIDNEEFIDTLLKMSDTKFKITAKIKNGKVKSFKIDFKDLAEKLQDEKYEKLFMADEYISNESRLEKTN